MYFVYIIKDPKGKFYFGYTNNIKRRLAEHNSGKSTYTRGRKWILVYFEAFASQKDALQREKQLKHYGQSRTHLKKRLMNSISKN